MSATPLPDSPAPLYRFPPPPRQVKLRSRGRTNWLGRLLLFYPLWLFITYPLLWLGIRGLAGPRDSRSDVEWILSIAFTLIVLFVGLFPLAVSVGDVVAWLRRRRVYREGQETVGTLGSKRCETGEMTTYHVVYSFVDATGRQQTPPECQIDFASWTKLQEGQTVAVLYDPAHPERCYLYEAGDDIIVAAR